MKVLREKGILRSVAAAILAVIVGCSNPQQVNEANPFFAEGLDYRKAGKYAEAAAAFEQCLRRSPDSEKAHLQLAMLYEDHLNDLNRAVVHYQMYLDRVPSGTQSDAVGEWLTRAEKRLYSELHDRYSATEEVSPPPMPVGPPDGDVRPPPPPTPAPVETASTEPVLSPDSTVPVPGTVEPRFYEVRSGDSLAVIARRELGHEKYWEQIYELNRANLPSPQKLQIGQRLLLPAQP